MLEIAAVIFIHLLQSVQHRIPHFPRLQTGRRPDRLFRRVDDAFSHDHRLVRERRTIGQAPGYPHRSAFMAKCDPRPQGIVTAELKWNFRSVPLAKNNGIAPFEG